VLFILESGAENFLRLEIKLAVRGKLLLPPFCHILFRIQDRVSYAFFPDTSFHKKPLSSFTERFHVMFWEPFLSADEKSIVSGSSRGS
jgi:hypothetical protein